MKLLKKIIAKFISSLGLNRLIFKLKKKKNKNNKETIQKHIFVVIDFYKRFTKRIIKMMENNKNTNIISIMGP